jgi:hypothetical protein
MSTTSKAQICNMALGHIRHTQTRIANLDTDQGETAAQCRVFYDPARCFVLSENPWKFARSRVALATTTRVETSRWLYTYVYPSDALSDPIIERATDAERPIPCEVSTGADGFRVIETNKENAVLHYTKNVTDVSKFSPGFVVALSWYLASSLAAALPGSIERQQAALGMYQNLLSAAQAQNAREDTPGAEIDALWIQEYES